MRHAAALLWLQSQLVLLTSLLPSRLVPGMRTLNEGSPAVAEACMQGMPPLYQHQKMISSGCSQAASTP